MGYTLARPSVIGEVSLKMKILAFFVFLVMLLPFAALPLPGGGSVRVVLLTLILFHVSWLVKRPPVTTIDRSLAGSLAVFLGLIVVAFGLGVWAFGYTPEAGLGAGNLALSALLLLGVPQTVRRSSDLRMLISVFVMGATIAAVIGIGLWLLPASIAERALAALAPIGYPDGQEIIRLVYGTNIERATGTSVDANIFGGLMMIAACLLAGQLLAREGLMRRWALTGCFLVIGTALALSFSRSAWVGMAVGLAYLGVFVERRALVFLALAAGLLLVTPQMRDRLAGAITVQDAASVLRVEEYRDSARLITEHPLLGIGFGPAFGLNLVRRVSNMYLLIAEEMGLAGLASLLVVIGLVIRRSMRRLGALAAAPDLGRGALSGVQAGFLGCLVAGLFDHYFMNSLFPHTAALFWLMAGLLVAVARFQDASIESERRSGHVGPGEVSSEQTPAFA